MGRERRSPLARAQRQMLLRGGTVYRQWALRHRKESLDDVVDAAHDLVRSRRYCTVVTIDADGRAAARTVQPWRPDDTWVIRFGTDAGSRKVADIDRANECLLVYTDEVRNRSVSIECRATINTDLQARRRWFMPGWSAFWPAGAGAPGFVIIECRPLALELWDGRAVVAPDPFGLASRRIVRSDGGWADPV